MLVRDYMTPYSRTLRKTDTLRDAALLFYKYKISGAPVVDENSNICGLITGSHLVQAIINDTSFSQPVCDIMTKNVITVTAETLLEEASQIPFGHLPVISSENKAVGMLTHRDLLRAFHTRMQQATDEVEAFIRSAHNGIIVINAYGIITKFNEAAARLTGVPVSAALNKPIDEVVPESGLRRVLATGKCETGCHVAINGQNVFSNRSPLFEGPRIVGALAIIQDTYELTQVARELTDTKHHVEALENIFESARHGIIVVDANGTITRVNKCYEDIYGVSRDELVGRPAASTAENIRLDMVARTGIPELGDIQEYKGRQIIVNRVPIFKDGKIAGAIGEAIFKDISEVGYLLERLTTLERQVSHYQLELKEAHGGKNTAEYTFADIIGGSRALVQAKNLAAKASRTDSNVLLLGESGTGKELFAHAIHNASHRRAMPFIAVNCAAIPADLLESELFGYDEGAFTGARKGGKKGKFELADKGTLFFDEIGDMPLAMQAKILRVLQDKSLEHIGGNKHFSSDVRIIAATNKPLAKMVQNHTFREDLYYRLNVISIPIPALRERWEDIGDLVRHLLPEICGHLGVPAKEIAPETMALLRKYAWPGNIRELVNLLEQLCATVDSPQIAPQHLAAVHFALGSEGKTALPDIFSQDAVGERQRILEVLEHTGNNRALAARLLGCHRSTFYEKLKKYGL